MTSASPDLRSYVTDVVTCPICLELFNSPKSLPCLHTFCLKCIEGHCRDNEPGDEVACPVCRKKFKIPESGIHELVSNFFITNLVEARRTTSDMVVPVSCEVCIDHSDGNYVPVSTMYCVDCNQKLCEQCSRPHRKMKGGQHKVVPIGSDVETDLIQMQGGKCDKHKNDNVRLYCFDCMMNICLMCFAEEHQQHKCKNVDTVAVESCKQIEADIGQIGERADVAHNEINRLDEERRKFLAGVEEVGEKILKRGEKLKQLIDKQVNELMAEVQVLKTENCKEIESQKENVEIQVMLFQTFSAYCSELKSKGKPCDITRAANDLHIRATELFQNDVTVDYRALAVTFRSMNIQELLVGGQNLIGVVKSENMHDSNQVSSAISLVTKREKTLEQQLSESVETERCLRQQIEVCNSQLTDNVNAWTEKVNELQAQVKQLSEQEIKMKVDKVESEKAFSELTVQCKQLRNTERDLRVKLESSVKCLKDLERHRQELTESENQLKSKLKMSEKSVTCLEGQCEQIRKNEAEMRIKFENSEMAAKKLGQQLQQLQGSESETKVRLGKSENVMKSLNRQLEMLRKSENSLKEEVKTATAKEKELKEQLKQVTDSEQQLKDRLQLEIVRRGCSMDFDKRINELLHENLEKRHGKEPYSPNEREEISDKIFEELKILANNMTPSTPITETFTADLSSVYSAYPNIVPAFLAACVKIEDAIEELRMDYRRYNPMHVFINASGISRELKVLQNRLSILPQTIVTRSKAKCYDHRMIEELMRQTADELRKVPTNNRELCNNINVMRVHICVQQLLLERVKELQKNWEEKANPLSVLEANKETYIAVIQVRLESECVRRN